MTSNTVLNPAVLWERLRTDWLILVGEAEPYGHEQWLEWVGDRRHQLKAQKQATHPKPTQPLALIAESDPQQFLAALWAALLANWDIALANPNWGHQEWQSVSRLIAPTLIWGRSVPPDFGAAGFSSEASFSLETAAKCSPQISAAQISAAQISAPQILIPTGGTSGHIKFAHHTWPTLLAAVNGFRQHFAPAAPVHSYCVLPLYHVSGLMQVLRTVISGGQIAIAPFKTLEATTSANALPFSSSPQPSASAPSSQPSLTVLSLVPTQLHRLLQAGHSQWLSQFHAVLLGGAPPWPSLLEASQRHHIPLSLSYGMTETAAMITAQKPREFLSGDRSSGTPLPHITLQILKDNTTPLPPNQTGQIAIHGPSIAAQPASLAQPSASQPLPHRLLTTDLGYLTPSGHLHVTGRASQTIISGGENISPTEVEAAIRSTGQVQDVCVVGMPDGQWGEVVTAIYVPCHKAVNACSLQQALRASPAYQPAPLLSRYKHPKRWLALETLPRNAQGKLNRQALIDLLQVQVQKQHQEPIDPLSS
ncbi:MAG: AMP-binding protein [Cyanobacteria bacterium P01_D01_bin.105]